MLCPRMQISGIRIPTKPRKYNVFRCAVTLFSQDSEEIVEDRDDKVFRLNECASRAGPVLHWGGACACAGVHC